MPSVVPAPSGPLRPGQRTVGVVEGNEYVFVAGGLERCLVRFVRAEHGDACEKACHRTAAVRKLDHTPDIVVARTSPRLLRPGKSSLGHGLNVVRIAQPLVLAQVRVPIAIVVVVVIVPVQRVKTIRDLPPVPHAVVVGVGVVRIRAGQPLVDVAGPVVVRVARGVEHRVRHPRRTRPRPRGHDYVVRPRGHTRRNRQPRQRQAVLTDHRRADKRNRTGCSNQLHRHDPDQTLPRDRDRHVPVVRSGVRLDRGDIRRQGMNGE